MRVMRASTVQNYYRQEFWEYDSATYWSRQTFSGANGWGGWAEVSGGGGGITLSQVETLIGESGHVTGAEFLLVNQTLNLVLTRDGQPNISTNVALPGGSGGGLTQQQVQTLIAAAGHATNLNAAYSTTTGLLTLTLSLDDDEQRQQSVLIPRYLAGDSLELVGDTFHVEAATQLTAGSVRLGSEVEVLAGTESNAVVTPITLQAKIDAIPAAEGGGVTEDQVETLIANNKVTYLTGDLNMDDIVAPGQYAYSRGSNTLTNQPTTNAGIVKNLGFQVWAQDGDVTGDLRQYARTTVPSVASYIRVRRAGEWFDWRAVIYVPSGLGNIGDVLTRIGTSEYHVSWAAPDYSSVTYTAGDGLDLVDNEFRIGAATTTNRGGVVLASSPYASGGSVVTQTILATRRALETASGIVELATVATETQGDTERTRAVTPYTASQGAQEHLRA